MAKIELKIDPSAFRALFADLDNTFKRAVDDAARGAAQEIYGKGFVVPTNIDALPMRKNADGVYVLNKRKLEERGF